MKRYVDNEKLMKLLYNISHQVEGLAYTIANPDSVNNQRVIETRKAFLERDLEKLVDFIKTELQPKEECK